MRKFILVALLANRDGLFEPSGKKHPNWDSVYMAKAITHYILHEPVFMKKALNEACRLDIQPACDDLKNLKRVHEHDFGLSANETQVFTLPG